MRSRIFKAGSFRGIFTLKIDRECLRVQLIFVRRKGNFPKIRRYYFRHRSLIVRSSPPLLVHQFQASHLSHAISCRTKLCACVLLRNLPNMDVFRS
jgi:hypothetical protein